MKKFFSLALSVIVLIGMFFIKCNLAFASSYYVYTKGNDKNAGTLEKPFCTIQKALDVAKAGDKVYIRKGTYNEQLTVKTSGTKDSPIRISNYNNETVKVDGSNKSSKNSYGSIALLSIINKSYITIEGIEFRNLSTTGTSVVHGITVMGYGDGVTIKNCKIHNIEAKNDTRKANGHGISVYGFDSDKSISNITLSGNEVYDCILGCSESIALNGNVTNFTVTKNIVHDNDNIGIDFIGHEGSCKSSSKDRARDGVCSDNYIYNITSKNNHVYGGHASAGGLYVDGGKNIIMERNILKNCDVGISIASEHEGKDADNIVIRNNLVTDCLSYAGIIFGGSSSKNGTAKNIKIYNNTVYHCKTGLVIQNANSSTNDVRNNIIYKSTRNAMYGTVGKNVVSNNLTEDPSFVDESNGNFRLKENSIAIDKGIKVDYGELDLDKNMRVFNGTVDMGCYEYVKTPVTITIDGSNRDWSSVKSISTNTGKLKDLKAYKDSDYLYVCVTGNKLNSYPNIQLFINSDNDTKTGFSDGGADYLVENSTLYKYAKKYGTTWDFESINKIAGYAITNDCVEYKIKLSHLKNLSSTIRLKVLLLDKSWHTAYQIPESGFAKYK